MAQRTVVKVGRYMRRFGVAQDSLFNLLGRIRIQKNDGKITIWNENPDMEYGFLCYSMAKVHTILEPLKPSYMKTHQFWVDQFGGGGCAHVYVEGLTFETVVSAIRAAPRI